tara:strand:- start:708 stop:1022 length:315 start_codon:yes stop_codon:yes gene_type:complete
MFPASFAPMIAKMVLPKIMDHFMKVFKLEKVLKYVEQPNELDVEMENVNKKCTDIGIKLNAMEEVLKGLGEDSHPIQPFDDRITKLEEFEQQVRRKKAFKRKDG